MKKYDPESRKYIDEEKLKDVKKKKQTCRGGRLHDMILVIPQWHRNKNEYTESEVLKFYELMDEYGEVQEEYRKIGEALNIRHGFGGYSWSKREQEPRHYSCSVCGKQDTKY